MYLFNCLCVCLFVLWSVSPPSPISDFVLLPWLPAAPINISLRTDLERRWPLR